MCHLLLTQFHCTLPQARSLVESDRLEGMESCCTWGSMGSYCLQRKFVVSRDMAKWSSYPNISGKDKETVWRSSSSFSGCLLCYMPEADLCGLINDRRDLLLLSKSEYFAASRCQTTQSGNVTSALTGETRVNGVRKTATEDYNIPRITEDYPINSPRAVLSRFREQ
jgi:hypothetical protein